ncbi:MAG: hypothetical protein ACREYE_28125 [Gammaproteobacteria bacterium]
MSETIAITGKSVKLFKGHYISKGLSGLSGGPIEYAALCRSRWHRAFCDGSHRTRAAYAG